MLNFSYFLAPILSLTLCDFIQSENASIAGLQWKVPCNLKNFFMIFESCMKDKKVTISGFQV